MAFLYYNLKNLVGFDERGRKKMKASFRTAEQADADYILAYMKMFYAEDGYNYHHEQAEYNLRNFIDSPDWGRAFVLKTDEGGIAGYMVIVFICSMEHQGRDAYIDELYISEEFRGRGYGSEGLNLAEKFCVEAGIKALHLEVERYKDKAIRLYKSRGFFDRDRFLLTKWIKAEDRS
jgi:diamine N-acetyltransferase